MKNTPDILKELGFNSWFEENSHEGLDQGEAYARVTAVHKDSFLIYAGQAHIPAEVTGRLAYGASSPLDFPTVGDWVRVRLFDEGALGIIDGLLPRKTLLKRKTPGKKTEHQLIAANVDTAFVIQGLDANFNLRRLERTLAMIHDGGINPVVLLSKSDLLEPNVLEQRAQAAREAAPEIPVICFSNKNSQGIDAIQDLLLPGKTYCLIGSSGVGKTTLLNTLLGQEKFETRAVREGDGKGRHATTRRQLTILANRAMIVDTPGMRELGNIGIEEGISKAFAQIEEHAAACRFGDCSHTHEKGCAVLAAVEQGEIREGTYGNYLKMRAESAYHESSYLEKRKKDKDFGKMVRTVMQNKKNRR